MRFDWEKNRVCKGFRKFRAGLRKKGKNKYARFRWDGIFEKAVFEAAFVCLRRNPVIAFERV